MGRIGCSHRVLFPLLDLSNMSRASYVYVIPSTDLCCKTHMFISISQRYCTVYADLVRLFFFFSLPTICAILPDHRSLSSNPFKGHHVSLSCHHASCLSSWISMSRIHCAIVESFLRIQCSTCRDLEWKVMAGFTRINQR